LILRRFFSETGMPIIVLAIIGAASWPFKAGEEDLRLFVLQFPLCLLFIAISPHVMYFNSYYNVLFQLPLWWLAARGVSALVQSFPKRPARCLVCIGVAILVLPRFVSYYQDGSRRDYREAARFLAERVTDKDQIYCDLPGHLGYYLPGRSVRQFQRDEAVSRGPGYIVVGSNGWSPVLHVPGQSVEMVSRIGQRRFDEQIYQVHIYALGRKDEPGEKRGEDP
jgi:hypothetical protein